MSPATPDTPWSIARGDDALVATAIHDGHALRPEVAEHMALGEAERRREEDPYTGRWTDVVDNRIVGRRSRFEVDLNRPRDKAVYLEPADAWGLQVWRGQLPDDVAHRSREIYDRFHAEVHEMLSALVARHGVVVVLDLHTYNHRREGPDGPVADAQANPEVNIGTGTLDREKFGGLVDHLMSTIRAGDFLGRHLDVRENIKFRGGNFSRWIHESFPYAVCAIAIEFKKVFMDEWTGELDERAHEAITAMLAASLPGLRSRAKALASGVA